MTLAASVFEVGSVEQIDMFKMISLFLFSFLFPQIKKTVENQSGKVI